MATTHQTTHNRMWITVAALLAYAGAQGDNESLWDRLCVVRLQDVDVEKCGTGEVTPAATLHPACFPDPGAILKCPTGAESGKGPCGPSVFVIGAQKSGTTSVNAFLHHHPQHGEQGTAETHFYDDPLLPRDDRGALLEDYISTMDGCSDEQIREGGCFFSDKTPKYIYCQDAAQMIAEDWPNARLILMLRNPVTRLQSFYYHWLVRRIAPEGNPVPPTADEFAAGEMFKFDQIYPSGDFSPDCNAQRPGVQQPGFGLSAIARGIYWRQIEWYLDWFPPEQIIVIHSDDMHEPDSASCVLRSLTAFLGLPAEPVGRIVESPHRNTADGHISKVGAPVTKFSEETVAKLQSFYDASNQELLQRLGVDWDWSSFDAPLPRSDDNIVLIWGTLVFGTFAAAVIIASRIRRKKLRRGAQMAEQDDMKPLVAAIPDRDLD